MMNLHRLTARLRKPITAYLRDNLYHAELQLEQHTAQLEQSQAMVDLYQGRVTRLRAELAQQQHAEQPNHYRVGPAASSASEAAA